MARLDQPSGTQAKQGAASATQARSQAPSSERGDRTKSALRGLDYSAQVQLLAPDGAPRGGPPPGPAGGPTQGGPDKGGPDKGGPDKVGTAGANGPGHGFSWSGEPGVGTQIAPVDPTNFTSQTAPNALSSFARGITDAIANIPNYHVIMEQLAHTYAYHSPDLSEADDLPGEKNKAAAEAQRLKAIGYRKKDVIESAATGFQVTLFEPYVDVQGKPIDPASLGLPGGFKLRPVLAFRGTDGGPDVDDDINTKGIGNFQLTMHAEQVRAMLATAGGLGMGKPDLTGHSLGGALAQRAAARFPSLMNDIITFQAPGIGAEASKVDGYKHASTHYMMEGDLVSQAGGAHTQGEVIKFRQFGNNGPESHIAYPLASLNAAHTTDRAQDGARPQNNHVPNLPMDKAPIHLGSATQMPASQHDSRTQSQAFEGVRSGVGRVIPSEQRLAAEKVQAEVEATVDEAVRDKVDMGSAKGRVAMVLHSRRLYLSRMAKRQVPFEAGILETIEKNAMLRYARSVKG